MYFDLKIDERCSFEEFVLMPTNAEANAAARGIAEGKEADSPLLICGGEGRGKTHLLHAIGGRYARLHPDSRVILTTASRMMANNITAWRDGKSEEFRTRYGLADLLLVDNVDCFESEKSLQELLIDLFKSMKAGGRLLAIANVKSASRLRVGSWLVSHSISARIVEIERMSEGGRFEFLVCQLKKRGVSISDENVSLLLRSVTGDASVLVRIAEDVRVASEAYHGEATKACVRDVLAVLEK